MCPIAWPFPHARQRSVRHESSVNHPRSSSHDLCDAGGVCPGDNDLFRPLTAQKDESDLSYTDRLRCLAINDSAFGEGCLRGAEGESGGLDPKTEALVRLAALVAVGGAGPSYGEQADAAVSAGATAAEIVEVLVGVVPIVGLPCVVAAAPKLAMALGYDLNDALEHQSGG